MADPVMATENKGWWPGGLVLPTLDWVTPLDPVNELCPLADGLLAAWVPLPATAGGRFLYDLQGRLPGTLVGGAEWLGDDLAGAGLSLDGTDDFVSMGADARLDRTGDLSVAVWVKSVNGSLGTNTAFAARWSGGQGYILWNNTNSNFIGFGDDESTRVQWSGGVNSLIDNRWHLLVGTRGPTNMKLWADGVERATSLTGTITSNGTAFTLGAYGGGTAGFLPGRIGAAAFWNRELSPGEVELLYLEGLSGWPALLNHSFPLPTASDEAEAAAGGGQTFNAAMLRAFQPAGGGVL